MTVLLELNNPRSSCESKKVRAIGFGILSPEIIMRMSVCEIKSLEIYENSYPKPNGLNDPRMGTTDYRLLCGTCNMGCKDCPAKPMYHIGFIRVTLSILRCVCYSCSRLLIDVNDIRFKSVFRIQNVASRFNQIVKLCREKKRCEGSSDNDSNSLKYSGCGCIQPKYSKDGISLMIQMKSVDSSNDTDEKETSGESKRLFQAEEALAILQRISNDDVRLLGFNPNRNHPAWMILTVLPIPPPQVRPYVQYGTDRSEDDITLKLLDIVKTNQQLKRQEIAGGSGHIIQEVACVLQYHIATLMNNDIPGLPVATTRSKKPIKSLRQRLKGKEGRLRGNLMGKRVDFSARTVITGDPNLAIDQVGVPKSVAMSLTYPETVTPFNITEMKKLVANGPFEWPGAKYIIRSDNTRYDLRHCQSHLSGRTLHIGDIVERHMKNDDYVLFNRQPSLHKMSIMGHKTKILPWSTFRLNLSVTSPYNADFDGDEMNLHLVQSHETRAEIKHLMMVPKQIVSSQGNRPVMGIVQDSLLGFAKLTKRDTFLTRDEIMNLLVWIPFWNGKLPIPAILHPKPLWTGKQLVTCLLNFDSVDNSNQVKINLTRDGTIKLKNDSEWCSENDGKIIIRNNEHLAGIICKRVAGSSAGSLIHVLWLEAGPEKTKQFLSISQKVINNWLEMKGFTVGCADIVAPEATSRQVLVTLKESVDKVNELILLAQKGTLETQPGKSLLQSFESRVNQELNRAREAAGKIAADSLNEKNNIIAMVNAGSKGSTINISQIMACVGQQNVEGKRIPCGFKDRSLPHFLKHDYGPHARGFVFNSYLTGLSPQELFFHAMGGREGIIDTACKTSETGYIQRRLMKAMEDVLVAYDGTVRGAGGEIVQFVYGEDNVSGEYIENVVLLLMRIDYKKMEAMFKHDFSDRNYGKFWIPSESIRNTIRLSFEQQSILDNEWQKLVEAKRILCEEIFPDGEAKQHLPLNVNRLIKFAKNRFPNESLEDMSPVTICKQLETLLNDLTHTIPAGENDYIGKEVQTNATTLLNIHLRTVLNSRKLMEKDKLGPESLKWLFGEILHQFNRALVHPGEVVGALSAQSIGEPATQMTLNTFHFAGVGSKNVTLGVPRLKELINVSKNVKTPSLTVYLKPHAAHDQDIAKSIQSHLEHTTLEKVASFAQVIYDPNPTDTIVEEDKQWVSEYYEFPDDDNHPSELGPWILRIQLIERLITDKQLTMKEIGETICAEFKSDEIDCIWTDDNSENLVIRIRVKTRHGDKSTSEKNEIDIEDEQKFLQRLMEQCLAFITLRGISRITKVYMREEKSEIYDAEQGLFVPLSQWVLDTDGCNLISVLTVDPVDATRTISNDITEVFQVLGIEAARRVLLKELRTVISFDGSYVNYRHLSILCDVMTQKGHLMAITRNGVNRVDRGCLAKCSFEETVEMLLNASMFGEIDYLRGVTENVMFGQLASFGTGLCDIVIDEEKLKDANPNFDPLSATLKYSEHYKANSVDAFSNNTSITSPVNDGLITLRDFSTTPFSPFSPTSPLHDGNISSPTQIHSPYDYSGEFSPLQQSPTSQASPMSPYSLQAMSPLASPLGNYSQMSPSSPSFISDRYNVSVSHYSPSSPVYNPSSPVKLKSNLNERKKLVMSPNYSPTSPIIDGFGTYSPTSPIHSPTSPVHSPASPAYSPTSPTYSPTSPTYSPTSPTYSPTSPTYSPTSPTYSPTSPTYSPTSPTYSPTSPTYSPTSPRYSPTSPTYSPTSPRYSPTSPRYSPTSPTSPTYSPTSPTYSPTSPTYSPTSPSYFQSSLNLKKDPKRIQSIYNPSSISRSSNKRFVSSEFNTISNEFTTSSSLTGQGPGAYSLTSPNYSPTSPTYSTINQFDPANPSAIMSPRYNTYLTNNSSSFPVASPMYFPNSPVTDDTTKNQSVISSITNHADQVQENTQDFNK